MSNNKKQTNKQIQFIAAMEEENKKTGQKQPNAEMWYITAAEKADAVSAFINTAGLTGGRATFMAGFSYYSVSGLID